MFAIEIECVAFIVRLQWFAKEFCSIAVYREKLIVVHFIQFAYLDISCHCIKKNNKKSLKYYVSIGKCLIIYA